MDSLPNVNKRKIQQTLHGHKTIHLERYIESLDNMNRCIKILLILHAPHARDKRVTCPLMLMDLCSIDGTTTNIRELPTNGTLCLCSPLDRHSIVGVYGAIESPTGSLINKGDFVAYHSTHKKVANHRIIFQ